MDKNTIKRVDYLDFISDDEQKRTQFIQDFGDSFSNMGFAIVANHGVSEALKTKLYKVAKKFFDLSDEEKKRYEDAANFGQRGFVSKNKESAKGQQVPDLKEFYHIGQQLSLNKAIPLGYPQNIWPEDFEEFKRYCLEVFRTLENTGKNLLKAIALYLQLPENYFDNEIKDGNSILRLLHYYPLSEELIEQHKGSVRAAAHGDINLITLLMGANAAGLQAQTLDGDWIDVMPKSDEIVINVGDMLSRLSNNKLRSTIHRVVNPTNSEALKSPRYSTPFFLHPHPDMKLNCLDSCISEDRPKLYEDITAGEFLTERLEELGLKQGA